MGYFNNYYTDLNSLYDTIIEDVASVENDDRLVASMINFAKDVKQLIDAAANNSAIEAKASQMPAGVKTHWWAGSGPEPNHQGDHESLMPHPNS